MRWRKVGEKREKIKKKEGGRGEKRKKRKRRKRKERGTNRVGRTIDREEKKSPLFDPQESRGLGECFARVLYTRVLVRAGKVESERKSVGTFDRCVAARCVLALPAFNPGHRYTTRRAEDIETLERSNSSVKSDIVFHFHSTIEWRKIFYRAFSKRENPLERRKTKEINSGEN